MQVFLYGDGLVFSAAGGGFIADNLDLSFGEMYLLFFDTYSFEVSQELHFLTFMELDSGFVWLLQK